jgi:hypothetical protein
VPEPVGVRRWFVGAAAVRSRLAGWRLAMLASEAVAPSKTTLVPAQLPLQIGAPWVGGAFAPGASRPRAGTVSLVLDLPLALGANDGWAGLLIDEWSEVIPDDTQDTSLAVHHDAPWRGGRAVRAPRGAAATPKGPGTLPSLEAIVNEAFDLAKIRAVDGDLLGPLGLLAPTTFLAANLSDDTIAVDLAAMTIGEATVLAAE